MPEIIVKLGDNIIQKNFFVRETMHIGRAPENEIVIENLAVSRAHATISHDGGRYLLTDLDSSNGTFVNGVRIKKTELMDRDVISIGKHRLYFYDQRASANDSSQRITMLDADRTMMVGDMQLPATEAKAELHVVKGKQKGETFALSASEVTLGRAAGNMIRLTDWFVSKEHAVIERQGPVFTIRDLGSWRHTLLNGTQIESAPLTDGDTINLGPTVQLTFSLTQEPAAEMRPAALRQPVELDEAGIRAALARPVSDEDEPLEPETAAQAAPEPPAEEPPLPEPEAEAEAEAENETEEEEAEEQAWAEVPLESPAGNHASEPAPASSLDDLDSFFKWAEEDAEEEPETLTAASVSEPLAQPEGEPADDPASELEEELEDSPPWMEPDHPTPAAPATPEPADLEPHSGLDDEIAIWERALQNKSPIIRKQAARRLKQLTGKDYEH